MSHDTISDATFARTSQAKRKDSTLTLFLSDSGQVRDSYFMELNEQALILEGQRINLVTDWDLSTWSISSTPVITVSQADPANGTSAFKVEDDNGSAVEYIHTTPSFTANAAKAIALFVKEGASAPAGGSQIVLRDTSGAADRLDANITWTAGAPVVVMTTGTRIRTIPFRSGWYLIWFRTTAVTAANTHEFRIIPAEVSAQTGDILAYGPQAEDGLFPSSPMESTGTVFTRVAENINWPFITAPQAITAYIRFVELGTVKGAASGILFSIGGSTGARFFIERGATTDSYRVKHNNGSSEVNVNLATTHSIGDNLEIRVTLKQDGKINIHFSVAGAAEVSGTESAALSLATGGWNENKLYLNWDGSSNYGFNAFQSIKISRGAQTMAFMRTFGVTE